MKKFIFFVFSNLMSLNMTLYGIQPADLPVTRKVSIIGGGIIGALESYYAYQDAQKKGEKVCVTVYEKGHSFESSNPHQLSTNTAYNIAPSLTVDEIVSVVPRGSELMEKLAVLFNRPGGIRVDDVEGVNDSEAALYFKQAATLYGSDKYHDDRTQSLLMLGKKSMDLWQQIYDEGDDELKAILEESNFNSCREPRDSFHQALHDGYRIDLISSIPYAEKSAIKMKERYEKLGYQHCAILSPNEVIAIDPFLADFCHEHSILDENGINRIWKNDTVALWRPGGCIDIHTFLPKFYAYLKHVMGQYQDDHQILKDCFDLQFGKEVIAIEFDSNSDELHMIGLKFSNDTSCIENKPGIDYRYVFCPGESVGTLHRLGFHEPVYAGFAGASLRIDIPLSSEQLEAYKKFSHCMEVHQEGVVLAWQAKCKEKSLFIGVAGTKAFYGDKQPNIYEEFAKDRHLLQLNIVNSILPQLISLAFGYNTAGKTLSTEELIFLEEKGIVTRWVGRRAVAYDGFPTFGPLYCNNRKINNARCTTHLGSGGVAFGPAAVFVSRSSEDTTDDSFVQKILMYSDSKRSAD